MARYLTPSEAKATQIKRLKEIAEEKKKQEKAKRQERMRQALAANHVIRQQG